MTKQFVTASEIARVLGRSREQVRHILDTRDIDPIGRAGLVRLFAPTTVDRVRVGLESAGSLALDYELSRVIVAGTGAGQPQGILNAPATISVAKEGSQVADTIVGLNVLKMYARCYGPARSRAVWLVNQDAEVQVMTAMKVGKLDTGAADTGWGIPLYTPPATEHEFGLLLGRPVIPTQACSTLGDQGDIILAGLGEYLTATKVGGMRTDISIHMFFDSGQTAFRMTFRLGGAPLWSATISGRDGASATLSPFVTLDERA